MCSPCMISNVSILYNYRKYGVSLSIEYKAENCYKQKCVTSDLAERRFYFLKLPTNTKKLE